MEWCSTLFGLFPCSHTLLGNLFLMLAYGTLLLMGAKLISDAAELLLLVWPPHFIGGVLLPVLNSIPLCTLVIVTGIHGSQEQAQDSVHVGMGTLIGTVTMLACLTWPLCLILGCTPSSSSSASSSVPLLPSAATPSSSIPTTSLFPAWAILPSPSSLFPSFLWNSEIPVSDHCQLLSGAQLSAVTSLLFLLLQVPAWLGFISPSHPRPLLSLAAALLCLLLAALYCVMEVWANPVESAPDKPASASPPSVHPPPTIHPLLSSAALLLAGFSLVFLFADPMVLSMTSLSRSLRIPPFFVSFVISPFASNASEFVSSLIFAAKRTKEGITLALSQVYGAIVMTNSLCLGVFYLLIFARGLQWEFPAEATVIVGICCALAACAGRSSSTTSLPASSSLPLLLLYPLSVAAIAVLGEVAGWKVAGPMSA